ncbi:MAG: hypothetical protein JWN44_3134, partial [Myxococcales bacterium]|nr:hypothetical protein [Myxococcales bacterium]
MGDDDDLFGPKPSATLPSHPQTSTPRPAATDVRAIPRALGGLLCALGRPTAAEIERVNGGLTRLALPLLTAGDLQQATPESLAPLVPVEAREGVAALMREVAGAQPIRARLVLAYVQLWGMAAPPAPLPPPVPPAGD